MDKTIANPEPSKVIGRASECMRRLMEAGLSFDALQMPIDDPAMRKRLVRFWHAGGSENVSTPQLARSIGIPMLGVEEIARYFGVKPTREQLATLAEIPFSEATLQECRDTHVLVAVFPLSIRDIRKRIATELIVAGYSGKSLVKHRGSVAMWQLVRQESLPGSTDKTYDEQHKLLTEREETPQSRVLIYTIIGYYLMTNQWICKRGYVRCSDIIDRNGCFERVHVCSHRDHVSFNTYPDQRYSIFGIASARKFDNPPSARR